MYLNGLYESENLHNSRRPQYAIQTTQVEVFFFFQLFYSFNTLTKEDVPKFKKTFEKYTVPYYLHNIQHHTNIAMLEIQWEGMR